MNPIHRFALPLVGVLLVSACGGDAHDAASPPPGPVDVTVAPLRAEAPASLFAARVVAGREVEVATRIAGTLREVAPLGTRVAPGDRVALLDDSDVRAGVRRAEAAAEFATRTADRMRNLADAGAASEQERDEAVAAEAAARASVEEARAQLAYVELRSPVAGSVVARPMQAGDLATPGRSVVRVASDVRELRAELPAGTASGIAPGDSVRLEGGGFVRVLRVSPALGAATRRFTVETTAPAALAIGDVVRIALGGGDVETHPVVPASAVVRRGQLTGVFTVEADTLRLRWIRLGRDLDGGFELLGGPTGLSEVVLDPAGAVDGAPVGRIDRSTSSGDAG